MKEILCELLLCVMWFCVGALIAIAFLQTPEAQSLPRIQPTKIVKTC